MIRYSFLTLGLVGISLGACGGDDAGSVSNEVGSGSPSGGLTSAPTTPGAMDTGNAEPGPVTPAQNTRGQLPTAAPTNSESPAQPGTATPAAPTMEPITPDPSPDVTVPSVPAEMPAGAGGAGGGTSPDVPSPAGAGGIGGGVGMDVPSPSLDPGAVVLQDNFDASEGVPDPAKWEEYEQWAQDQGIAPVIDTSKAHSAPNSVKVASSNVGQGSFLVPVTGFPVDGNSFYVRVYVNWEKATSSITGHSGFLVGATARDNSGTELRLGISDKGPGDEAMMDVNLIGGEGGEVTRYSNGFTDGGNPADFTGAGFQFAADTWYCLEAYFGGGAASEFRVWVDGSEIADMHVTDFQGSQGGEARTSWAPSYTVLKIGAQDYDANLGSIWYDDIVIATSRVGCD